MAALEAITRRGLLKALPATLAVACAQAEIGSEPEVTHVRILGSAGFATWEEDMAWAMRGLPDAEAAAMWAKYSARRAGRA
jgi:hypothetical protein